VLTALNHALRSRDVRSGQLIFHSDKGAQYTALRFTQRLLDAGVAPRPAAPGTASTTRWPRTSGPRSRSSSCTGPAPRSPPRTQAEHAVVRYIDGWYNPRRIQANSTTPTGNPHSGKRGNLTSHRAWPAAMAGHDGVQRQVGDRRSGGRAGYPVGRRNGGDGVVIGEPEGLVRAFSYGGPCYSSRNFVILRPAKGAVDDGQMIRRRAGCARRAAHGPTSVVVFVLTFPQICAEALTSGAIQAILMT